MKKKDSYIIGLDEVGRGALAGPVVVAAAAISKEATREIIGAEKILGKLKDSKELSPGKREEWLEYFEKSSNIAFVSARIYPRGIEKLNISKAANKAALSAYVRLVASGWSYIGKHKIFLDGGLYLGGKNYSSKVGYFRKEIKTAKTVIKGDEKITAIKIASIVAKVSRDSYMRRLAKKYPKYGFDVHKGYGTKAHFLAIKTYGKSSVHRKTFIN